MINPGIFYRPTVNLEELSIRKQIRTKLEKKDYEELYHLAIYHPKTHKLPNPTIADIVNGFCDVFFRQSPRKEVAKEHKYHKNPFHPLNVINSILFPSASGREAAEEYKARRMRNLAREVIAKKYPDHKQPTQLGDYL